MVLFTKFYNVDLDGIGPSSQQCPDNFGGPGENRTPALAMRMPRLATGLRAHQSYRGSSYD